MYEMRLCTRRLGACFDLKINCLMFLSNCNSMHSKASRHPSTKIHLLWVSPAWASISLRFQKYLWATATPHQMFPREQRFDTSHRLTIKIDGDTVQNLFQMSAICPIRWLQRIANWKTFFRCFKSIYTTDSKQYLSPVDHDQPKRVGIMLCRELDRYPQVVPRG